MTVDREKIDPTIPGVQQMLDQADQRATDAAMMSEEERTAFQAEEAAKRAQYARTGDLLDTGMGGMGGAGASAVGPDLAKQSAAMPGNHADLPAGQR